MLSLTVEERKIIGKTSKRLSEDKMAAVYYGHKEKSTPIIIKKADFKRVFKQAGESTVVVLENAGKKLEALIHEVDFDPIKGEPRHADFYILEKGQKVTVSVPVHFEGEAPAIKLGGILVKVMHEIEVEAEPSKLPHAIVVDVSMLVEMDSRIAIKDVILPSGVSAIEDADETVALIALPKEEKEEEAPVDLATAVEVEKKGKKEEEGAASDSADSGAEKVEKPDKK
ncbi:MAG: 50S ribosomal protein L25 [bacterium]|nr:50S ribosomal protein L25 [bacterium]